MTLLTRIVECNQYSTDSFYQFFIDEIPIGWIHKSYLPILLGKHDEYFTLIIAGQRIIFLRKERTPQEISTCFDEIVSSLQSENCISDWTLERHGVHRDNFGEMLFTIPRVATDFFGITTYGTHLNGIVCSTSKKNLWLARRALHDKVEAGKLDNMAAGGLTAGLKPLENMVNEAKEEAGLSNELLAHVTPVGEVSYTLQRDKTLATDVMFCFDILLPESFHPVPDGDEISGFTCLPMTEILKMLESGDGIKYNSALVMINTLMRHQMIPVNYPHYELIIEKLKGSSP